MKRINSILLLITCSLILFSCEKVIEFDNELIEPQLVINGFIQQDSLIDVSIASSKPIPGVQTDFKWIDNATVKLFVDGVEKETLTVKESSKDPIGFMISNGDTTYFYDPSAPTKRYCSLTTKAEVGKTYKVEVTHPDFEVATCETFIPEPITILAIDTLSKNIVNEYYSNSVFEIKIKFKDTPGVKNYYRLVYTEFKGDPRLNYDTPDEDDYIIMISNNKVGTYINTEDQLINPSGEEANDFLFGGTSNRYNVFSDELIDGKEYELSFFINGSYYSGDAEKFSGVKGEFMNLNVELQSITREAYLYMKSVQAHNSSDGFFTEPVQVFTNIENGIGIFAGFSSNQKNISKGEYPVDGVVYEQYENGYW